MNRIAFVSLVFSALVSSAVSAADAPAREAVEATSIELIVDHEGAGMALVKGCRVCPLQVTVDVDTEFRASNKRISLDKARVRSGSAGTVLYHKDEKRAVRIIW